MQLSTTYEQLESIVSSHQGPSLPDSRDHSVVSTKTCIDQLSLKVIDRDLGLWPIQVYGEGNCLPSSLSLIHYGTPNHKDEMRARIVVEGVLHKDKYLDEGHLVCGANKKKCDEKLASVFALYSEQYTPGDVLTESVIERIYENELLEYTKNGTYSGIWQLAMAAFVLKRIVYSHYPTHLSPSLVNHLGRCFVPVDCTDICRTPAHIQWTYSHVVSGVPNHFVPLLPMLRESQETISTWQLNKKHPSER